MVVVVVKFEKMQKKTYYRPKQHIEHVIWAMDMALHRPELIQ